MSKVKSEIVVPAVLELTAKLYEAARQQVLDDPSQDLGEVMTETFIGIAKTFYEASGKEVIMFEMVHCKDGCEHCRPDELEPKSAEMEKIFNSDTVN